MEKLGRALIGPLEGLRGALATRLEDGRTDSDGRVAAPQVPPLVEVCDELLRLTEDYLAFIRATDGSRPVHNIATTIRSLLDELYLRHRDHAAASGHEWKCTLTGPDAPVRTDPLVWHTILDCAVGNALRHTPRCGRVHAEAQHDDRSWSIAVSDSGPGIPADLIDEVQRPFKRLNGTGGRPTRGSGLGLALARALATRLGGTLELESSAGHGTTVRFTLPFVGG